MTKQINKKFATLFFLICFLFIIFPFHSIKAGCCKQVKYNACPGEDPLTCKEANNQSECLLPEYWLGNNSCSEYPSFCNEIGCCKQMIGINIYKCSQGVVRINCQDCFFPNKICITEVAGCEGKEPTGCCVRYLDQEKKVVKCEDDKIFSECTIGFEAYFKSGASCADISGCPQQGETKKEETKPSPPLNFIPSVAIPGSIFKVGAIIPVSGNLIAQYISAIFEFFVAIAAILAVVMIMIAGIMWMFASGSSEKIGEARKMIGNAVMGLILALSTYTILNLINPNLVILKNINLISIERKELEYHGQKYKIDGTQCEPLTSGPCSVKELSKTCFNNFGVEIVRQAAGICKIESGGRSIPSTTDKCESENKRVVSFGLFQINISAHKINGLNCPSAFNHPFEAKRKDCYVLAGKTELYNQCRDATLNNTININKACEIYASSKWKPWGANRICQF
ncbi:MAG: pilin [Candidatus Kuenenbacteria bacterium]